MKKRKAVARTYDPHAARSTKGMGSVYPYLRKKRDGSTYEVWVAAMRYRDLDGIVHRITEYTESEQAAKDKLLELHNRPDVKQRIAPAKDTVGEFFENWLTNVVSAKSKPSTLATYRSTYRAYIESDSIAKVALSKVTYTDVERFLRSMTVAPKKAAAIDKPAVRKQRNFKTRDGVVAGARTRLKVYDLLSGAFKAAMKRRLIATDPMLGIERPAYAAPAVKALSPEQIDAFLSAAQDDPLEALYVLTIFTGLRSAEVLALRWGDVDLKAGMVYVNVALQDTGAKVKHGEGPSRVIGAPKTKKSARPLPLFKIAADALRRHHKSARQIEPSDLVFPSANGKPRWRQNILDRSFYPLLAKAGLVDEGGKPLLTFHGLRHVHGTEMLRAGMHPKIVQERLGHTRIGTTMDTYTSSVPGLQEAAVKELSQTYGLKRRARSRKKAYEKPTSGR